MQEKTTYLFYDENRRKIMRFLQKYWYKLLIILITMLILIFVFPNITDAKGFIESAGGALWEAIQDFLVWIGDCVLNLLQNTFLTQQRIVVTANSSAEVQGVSAWSILLLLGSIALVIVGGAFAWTGIGAAGFVAGLKGVCIGIACVTGGIVAGSIAVNDMSSKLSGEFDIPMIAYTPYAIFSNSVPALDINFVKPKDDIEDDKVEGIEEVIDFDKAINAGEKLISGINKITEQGKNNANYNTEIAERILNGNSTTENKNIVEYLTEWKNGAQNINDELFFSLYSPSSLIYTINLYMQSENKNSLINMSQEEYDELIKVCGSTEGAGFHAGVDMYRKH